MKVVAIVGSLRKDSYNLHLVHSMRERYGDRIDIHIADIGNLPFYNQDIEENPPESVLELKRAIREAEAVLIVTPEYNWSVPGVLKNALDWLSRGDRVLVDKPVLTAGVTPVAMGTLRAQLHLREILAAPGISARTLAPAGNEILVTFAGQKFDAAGRLVDEPTLTFLDGVIQKFIDFVQQPVGSR